MGPNPKLACEGAEELLVEFWRWRLNNSLWIASSCCFRKNCFCARERESSTADAIFWDTSSIDACFVNIWDASENKALLGDGVHKIAVQLTFITRRRAEQSRIADPIYRHNHEQHSPRGHQPPKRLVKEILKKRNGHLGHSTGRLT